MAPVVRDALADRSRPARRDVRDRHHRRRRRCCCCCASCPSRPGRRDPVRAPCHRPPRGRVHQRPPDVVLRRHGDRSREEQDRGGSARSRSPPTSCATTPRPWRKPRPSRPPMGNLGDSTVHTRSILRPHGVFAVISPFNFPMALAAGPTGGRADRREHGRPQAFERGAAVVGQSTTAYIEAGVPRGVDHVVVLMMENRSFDHMLGFLTIEQGRDDIEGPTHGDEERVSRRVVPCSPGGADDDDQGAGPVPLGLVRGRAARARLRRLRLELHEDPQGRRRQPRRRDGLPPGSAPAGLRLPRRASSASATTGSARSRARRCRTAATRRPAPPTACATTSSRARPYNVPSFCALT